MLVKSEEARRGCSGPGELLFPASQTWRLRACAFFKSFLQHTQGWIQDLIDPRKVCLRAPSGVRGSQPHPEYRKSLETVPSLQLDPRRLAALRTLLSFKDTDGWNGTASEVDCLDSDISNTCAERSLRCAAGSSGEQVPLGPGSPRPRSRSHTSTGAELGMRLALTQIDKTQPL